MIDYSLFVGVFLGAGAVFGTGFLKKAGEDFYLLIKRRYFPNKAESTPTQVLVTLQGSQSQLQSSAAASTLAPIAVELVSSLTVEQITSRIRAAPPLQQENVANAYLGIRVEWLAYFVSGTFSPDRKNISVGLVVRSDDLLPDIYCSVSAEENKELNVLPRGSAVRVAGVVGKASSAGIELVDARLEIVSGGT